MNIPVPWSHKHSHTHKKCSSRSWQILWVIYIWTSIMPWHAGIATDATSFWSNCRSFLPWKQLLSFGNCKSFISQKFLVSQWLSLEGLHVHSPEIMFSAILSTFMYIAKRNNFTFALIQRHNTGPRSLGSRDNVISRKFSTKQKLCENVQTLIV